MTKFKAGDIIVCVNPDFDSKHIKKGSKYEVESVRGDLVSLVDQNGIEWWADRFELDESSQPFQGLETAYDNKPSPQNWEYAKQAEEFSYPHTLYKTQSVEELQEAEAQRVSSLGTPVLNAFKSLTGVSLTNAQYDILKGLEQLYKGAQ